MSVEIVGALGGERRILRVKKEGPRGFDAMVPVDRLCVVFRLADGGERERRTVSLLLHCARTGSSAKHAELGSEAEAKQTMRDIQDALGPECLALSDGDSPVRIVASPSHFGGMHLTDKPEMGYTVYSCFGDATVSGISDMEGYRRSVLAWATRGVETPRRRPCASCDLDLAERGGGRSWVDPTEGSKEMHLCHSCARDAALAVRAFSTGTAAALPGAPDRPSMAEAARASKRARRAPSEAKKPK